MCVCVRAPLDDWSTVGLADTSARPSGLQNLAVEDMVLLFPELEAPGIRKRDKEDREHMVRMHTLSKLKG